MRKKTYVWSACQERPSRRFRSAWRIRVVEMRFATECYDLQIGHSSMKKPRSSHQRPRLEWASAISRMPSGVGNRNWRKPRLKDRRVVPRMDDLTKAGKVSEPNMELWVFGWRADFDDEAGHCCFGDGDRRAPGSENGLIRIKSCPVVHP